MKLKKEIAYVGLGKMGKNMVLRLLEHGWKVHAYDTDKKIIAEVVKAGATPLTSLAHIKTQLSAPRLVWVMVPAGEPVDEVIFGKEGLTTILEKNDIIIDGGNSFYEDTVRRASKLKNKKIRFMDIGTSGGPRGAREGACLMIGGDKKLSKELEPLYQDLASPEAYAYFGPSGSGHFVKMVHNGIEYGMMQAIAEGFSLMKKSPFHLNMETIAQLYNRRSVVESRLVGWLKDGFDEYGEELKAISGTVGATGEGEWTVKTAKKMNIPVPIIEGAYQFRVQSKKNPSYTGQLLSVMRNQFGGHDALRKKK